jgi:glycosyltransferase involved in cell wall biosynthesis
MIRISLLMPCRDAGPYLGESLDSALAQLGPADELVVQDGMSSDGSALTLDRAAERDPRMRVRHAGDRGQSDALDHALDRATGDLVGWLNADDLLLPGALPAVRAACAAFGRTPDVVVGRWRVISADGSVLRDYPAARLQRNRLLLRGCYAFSGALLIRRALLDELGGFRVDLHYAMDLDLMLRIADAAETQLLVTTPLAAFRLHAASKTGELGWRFARDGLSVRRQRSRGAREAAAALAGSALTVVSVATFDLRFGPRYSRLRSKVRR